MPFATIDYIAFFAILFFAYYAIPRRFQRGLLLIGSLVFYGWMAPSYLIFLLATVAITYAGSSCFSSCPSCWRGTFCCRSIHNACVLIV